MEFSLRYDLRAPSFARAQADLFEACLDQCQWADEVGFDSVGLQEHHGSEDGYNPSPFALSAAIAARTKRIRIRIAALILPLHDPIRVAEDAAVVDQISRGRLELIVGAGYVRREFEMFDKRLDDRVRLQSEGIETLRQAWTGDPFERHGTTVRVTPRPFRPSGPPLFMGGSSAGAAKRAARIADGFEATMPEFDEIYRQECISLGRPAPPPRRPSLPAMFVHLALDPDAAWSQIAPHALHEMNSYGKWIAENDSVAAYHQVDDADGLRASGLYLVLTPGGVPQPSTGVGTARRAAFPPVDGRAGPRPVLVEPEAVRRAGPAGAAGGRAGLRGAGRRARRPSPAAEPGP